MDDKKKILESLKTQTKKNYFLKKMTFFFKTTIAVTKPQKCKMVLSFIRATKGGMRLESKNVCRTIKMV